jgi:hypothetical protein
LQTHPNPRKFPYIVDQKLLERFRGLVARADAAVVLSSTWRYDPAGLFSAKHWGIPFSDELPLFQPSAAVGLTDRIATDRRRHVGGVRLFRDEPDRVRRGCCHATRECGLMPEKRKQNDDWNRHSEQPKKNSSTHDRLLYLSGCRTRASQMPWRNEPPSSADRPAAKAGTAFTTVAVGGDRLPFLWTQWSCVKFQTSDSGSGQSLEIEGTSVGHRVDASDPWASRYRGRPPQQPLWAPEAGIDGLGAFWSIL